MRGVALTALAFAAGAALAAAPGPAPVAAASAAPASELRFAEIYRLPAGPRGLELSARARALVGARVRIAGYVVRQQRGLPDGFILAPYPVETDEAADGLADDLPPAVLYVHAGTAAPPAPGALLRVEGVLEWGALEEADGRISWLRLRADSAPATALP